MEERRRHVAEVGKTEQEIVDGLIESYQNLEKQKENPPITPIARTKDEARKLIEQRQEEYINEAKKYGVDLLAEIEKRKAVNNPTPETERQTQAEREQEEQARRTAEAEDERRVATERANDATTTPPSSDTGAKETADATQSEAKGMEAVSCT